MRHSSRSPSRNGAPSRMLCARRYAGSSRSTLHAGASRRPSGSRWVDGGNLQFYEGVGRSRRRSRKSPPLRRSLVLRQNGVRLAWRRVARLRQANMPRDCSAVGPHQGVGILELSGPPRKPFSSRGGCWREVRIVASVARWLGVGAPGMRRKGGRVLNPNDLRRYRETIAKSVVFAQLEPDDVDLILSSCRLLDTDAGGFALHRGVPRDG